MACGMCFPAQRRHCPTGEELLQEVQRTFASMVEYTVRTGGQSAWRAERYAEAKTKYRAHVGESER